MAKKVAVKTISVNFQRPGCLPEVVKVPAESTVATFVKDMNIEGYSVSLNGYSVATDSNAVLSAKDVVRIGVKTKNNR